ncbi:SIR2 family protein [uncultured Psychroserpens sp.]|uniref:SIR2 family protein n=1 Tax=uncultured Psychroserpens sp. TaxID=255436 RepID=UPI00260D372D|nr:SIR2 family protein [uncultured Psychroserpens sp.]
MVFSDDKFPEELLENFQNNRGAFFVGAGMSIEAGLPSWGQLITNLIDLAENKAWISKDRISEYRKLQKEGNQFLLLAEELKVELGDDFYEYIENTFGNPKINPTNTMISILEIKSSMIITSNYDMLIENAYIKLNGSMPSTFKYSQSREIANNYWKEKFFILKVHGDAKSDVNGIILSQKDYRKTLYREIGYKSILQSIFSTKSIFFVGTSMTDPEFNLLLDYLHESYHGGGPSHFLLIEESSTMPVLQKRFSEDFNIKTITYKNDSGKHSEINDYMIELNKRINA